MLNLNESLIITFHRKSESNERKMNILPYCVMALFFIWQFNVERIPSYTLGAYITHFNNFFTTINANKTLNMPKQ